MVESTHCCSTKRSVQVGSWCVLSWMQAPLSLTAPCICVRAVVALMSTTLSNAVTGPTAHGKTPVCFYFASQQTETRGLAERLLCDLILAATTEFARHGTESEMSTEPMDAPLLYIRIHDAIHATNVAGERARLLLQSAETEQVVSPLDVLQMRQSLATTFTEYNQSLVEFEAIVD